MIIQKQMATEMVEDKEIQKETGRIEIYNEVEKETVDGEKVVIKEFAGSFTKEELENDIANLDNNIRDLQNQKRDKENILEGINK